MVRLHDDLLNPLEAFIAEQDDSPSRPEAVRRLLREQLVALGNLSRLSKD